MIFSALMDVIKLLLETFLSDSYLGERHLSCDIDPGWGVSGKYQVQTRDY